ncbi:hypothetical protein BJ991_000098 [Microbacterium immunditiarum]|uniref:Uncharacterized protein n=1 Tax=Microbacterium immunditiarum TaxID=337480 RepID=A0A7Y9KHU9_9MICO|nr:hypothetical protein [Microbacterium immunditiarum]
MHSDTTAIVKHFDATEALTNIDEQTIGRRLAGQACSTRSECHCVACDAGRSQQASHFGRISGDDHCAWSEEKVRCVRGVRGTVYGTCLDTCVFVNGHGNARIE